MFDMVFYVKLLSGLGFIFAGIAFIYGNKKNPNKYKNGVLAAILTLSAGVLQLISAVTFILQ